MVGYVRNVRTRAQVSSPPATLVLLAEQEEATNADYAVHSDRRVVGCPSPSVIIS